MISFNGNSAELLSKVDTRVLRERKDDTHNVDYGRIIDVKPKTGILVVEDQQTGKISEWQKEECISVLDYAAKKEKQLDVASYAISVQNSIIKALTEENEKLGGEVGKKLNCVA